ncbi:hypothetical protein [Chryseolinea lacunae]|uniref:Uncharacterized protein n=1 Tax=Chryseolinea lacunae TaxID=2801331 RepID=A0ABS1KYP9_9BACT|nr:hypothetical protein [Chryseolinea lacunae]MBL0744580.1 hypothetical protein [Chryseolinea lacunae]
MKLLLKLCPIVTTMTMKDIIENIFRLLSHPPSGLVAKFSAVPDEIRNPFPPFANTRGNGMEPWNKLRAMRE